MNKKNMTYLDKNLKPTKNESKVCFIEVKKEMGNYKIYNLSNESLKYNLDYFKGISEYKVKKIKNKKFILTFTCGKLSELHTYDLKNWCFYNKNSKVKEFNNKFFFETETLKNQKNLFTFDLKNYTYNYEKLKLKEYKNNYYFETTDRNQKIFYLFDLKNVYQTEKEIFNIINQIKGVN